MSKKNLFLIGLFPVLLLLSCDFYSTSKELELLLPPLPAFWNDFPGAMSYDIEFFGEGDVRKTISVSEIDVSCPPSVNIDFPKKINRSVLVYPRIQNSGERLLPAGALYPWSLDSADRLVAAWKEGPPAYILDRCTEHGFPLTAFNGKRFLTEFAERTKGDPWLCDLSRIEEKLLYGRFRVSYIRPGERYSVSAVIPEGLWQSENCLKAAFFVPSGPCYILDPLASGLHRFYSLEQGLVLSVFIDEKDRYSTLLRPISSRP